MRLLVIGGTGFIGAFVVRELVRQGHEVTVFHRRHSASEDFGGVHHIHGDRDLLTDHSEQLRRVSPDVIIDTVLSSARQANQVMDVFRGYAGRVVAVSSQDVYRAVEVLQRIEEGPLQALPLTEESELRHNLHTYPPQVLKMLQTVFGWLDDEYDKIPVEQTVMGDAQLPGTVLRLPMVYGPGDPLHRLYPILKRVDDGRRAILLEEGMAQFRASRGYVENVAAGIALAAVSAKAAGRTYNIAEIDALTEVDWTRKVGAAAGWNGHAIALAPDRTPAHLRLPYNTEQHWVVSSERIREELGYAESVPVDIALERTIKWERLHPPRDVDPRQFDYEAEDAALRQVVADVETEH